MRRRLLQIPVRYPLATLAAVAIITVAFALQLHRLYVESDWMKWIPKGDDAATNLEELENIFGSSYLVRVLVVRDDHPDGIYNPHTLALIAEITDWMRTRPELETGSNADLRSLTTVNDIRGDESGMVVEPFMEVPPTTRDEALAIRKALHENGIYVGLVAAYDDKAAAIVVRQAREMRDRSVETYRAIRAYLDSLEARGIPERLYITGRPIVEGLFDIYIPEEGYRLLPWVVLMMSIFLYASLRSVRGIVLPLVVTACTEVWMFGFLALWGHPMYAVTSILPILIVSIAVAGSIHVLAHYDELALQDPTLDHAARIERAVDDMLSPVFLTSLTTIIGFLSMVGSALDPIRDFGIIIAVGIASTFILTLAVIPASLKLLPDRFPSPRRAEGRSRLDRWLRTPARFADRRPSVIIRGFSLALVIAMGGMMRLTTDSSQVGQFPPSHHLRRADSVDNAHFAGSNILDVLVDAHEPGALKNPDLLRRLDAFQQRMQEPAVVGDTFSIAELIKRMNRVMNEDRPEEERIPDSRDLVAQYLLLYSISGDPGDFDDLVDYDYRYAHAFVMIRDPGTATSRAVVAEADAAADDIFGGVADVRFSGQAYMNTHLERYVTSSQLYTLAICLPTLFALAWIVFRNPVLGLLCITPVTLAVALIYGGMGYIGLPTDIGTTMLGGMTLGIGIDFAIHYLYRYRLLVRAGHDARAAAEETARTAGRALFYNAVVLIGGFIVLLGARLYPQVKLGGLISATMIICYTATMLLFPAVLGRMVRGGRAITTPPADKRESAATPQQLPRVA